MTSAIGNGDASSDPDARPTEQHGRSAAEWTTLIVSLALILAVVAFVAYHYAVDGSRPPAIEAAPLLDAVRREGAVYHVPVEVANRGGQTARQVVVGVSLAGPDETERSEFEVDALPGGKSVEGVVVFSADPSAGELVIDVVSYLQR